MDGGYRIASPNIGEAVVKADKLPGVVPTLKALGKADLLISAIGFIQDLGECASHP